MKPQTLEIVNRIQNLLEEELRIASNLFPSKAPFSRSTGENGKKFWPKKIKRDVLTLRNRAILLRRLARLNLSNIQIHHNSHNIHNTLDYDR